jgi:hypothetical protein
MLRTIILVTRGIILDPRTRRWAMFIMLLAAVVMIFADSTFLAGEFSTPLSFIIYWGICGWLTLGALLLALWDLILVRIAARKERIRLEKQMLDHPPHDGP